MTSVKPVNITYLTHIQEFGGCEHHLLQLIESLDSQEFNKNIIFITDTYFSHNTEPFFEYVARLQQAKIIDRAIHLQIHKGLRDIRKIWELTKVISKQNSILHVYKGSIDSGNIPIVIALALNKIVIQTIQNKPAKPDPQYLIKSQILRPYCLRTPKLAIAVSNSVRQDCIDHYQTPRNRIQTIHNGINLTDFKSINIDREEKKRQIEREYNINLSDKTIFLNVARLSEQKGHIFLFEALLKISQQHRSLFKDLILLLVGNGPLEKKLKQTIKEYQLEDNVIFLGFRKDINELLACADAFLLSSLYEGLPLTIVEAMPMAKPVLATAVDGVSEIVSDGETGLLSPPRNAEELANTILRFMNLSRPDRIKMGRKGQEVAMNQFNLEHQVREIEKIYQKLWRQYFE